MSTLLYVEMDFFCVFVLVVLLTRTYSHFGQRYSKQLLGQLLIAIIAFCFSDALWMSLQDGLFGPQPLLAWLVNDAYFILCTYVGYLWFSFSEATLDDPQLPALRHRLLILLPFGLSVILVVTSPLTHLVYSIDAAGSYYRGPFFALSAVIAFLYAAAASVRALRQSFTTELFTKRREYRALSLYLLPTLAGGILQAIHATYPILAPSATLAALLVFVNLQGQLISVDSLTDVNNRHQLMHFIHTRTTNDDGRFFMLMMDIDGFKSINDRFGHLEGDAALRRVARGLRIACANTSSFIARYGGDEFIVITEADDRSAVDALCQSIAGEVRRLNRAAGATYDLELSMGISERGPEHLTDSDWIAAADSELYREKKRRGAQGRTL